MRFVWLTSRAVAFRVADLNTQMIIVIKVFIIFVKDQR
ncbi:hypothetical protein DES37_101345 [Mangrovibacter plantisponsor]|uniref:Uncharacterized protein n=1 Tax=Mangrovibacter plantisponsor TaxID=451513 RepID=A0A317Q880_9ENTR|nr:hypothetical protein DES37_101345 [Mangrovibacter plantisponsor]